MGRCSLGKSHHPADQEIEEEEVRGGEEEEEKKGTFEMVSGLSSQKIKPEERNLTS